MAKAMSNKEAIEVLNDILHLVGAWGLPKERNAIQRGKEGLEAIEISRNEHRFAHLQKLPSED